VGSAARAAHAPLDAGELAAGQSCWDVHTFVVPVLGHERGFSASVIGSILGAFAIAAALVRVVMPLVAAHLRTSGWWWRGHGHDRRAVCHLSVDADALAMGLCSVLLGWRWARCSP
jgi:hypothetical protein